MTKSKYHIQGFAKNYGVTLLFETAPQIDPEAILTALRKHCGSVHLSTGKEQDFFLFSFPDHLQKTIEGHSPAQCFITTLNIEPDKTALKQAIQQSWWLENAQALVEPCTHHVLFSDFMSDNLPYKERHQLFINGLCAILPHVNCQAIYWPLSQQIIDPKEFLFYHQAGDHYDFLYGSLNIRLFNVEGTSTMIMDTLGLAALGLPDIQCHFKNLEPNEVSVILESTAYFIYENGHVVEAGDKVQGLTAKEEWVCQFQESLVEPKRTVIDLNSGTLEN